MTRTYSTVVLGGTPGGIAAGIRAAREGHDVLLVTYNEHLGGMMTSGLSYTDTLMMKPRSPVFAEFRAAVRDHYRTKFGDDSDAYDMCEQGYIFEPHVGEEIFDALVADESRLDVLRGYHPTAIERDGRTLNSMTVESFDGDETVTVAASIFVEATYEGDLLATAGVPYRLGRESRSKYDEQFAGELYTRTRGDRYYPQEAVGEGVDPSAPADRRGPLDTPLEKRQGSLDLVPHPAGISEIHPKSTGTGDHRIQAYSYRLCLTDNPENRIKPDRPDDYDREDYIDSLEEVERVGLRPFLRLRYLPNDKADMNTADLPGENYDYPEADWERRTEIADRHKSHILGLLYFLQNDDAVADDMQKRANEWGLAADEFVETDNFPFQLYVREARRLDGRYTFTEGDARHATGLDRAPVLKDSIAVAEYPLDSHACKPDRQARSHPEGHFFASQVTRPAHVPYRTVLPKGVDNLLVPVPLSASHVGYGSIRLEPTWLHIGESVGYAIVTALETDTPPADIDRNRFQHRLAENAVMLSFFNDFEVTDDEPWTAAVQFLGTRGFFESYDADPEAPLTVPVASEWASTAAALLAGESLDATERARRLMDVSETTAASASEFADELRRALDWHGVEAESTESAFEQSGVRLDSRTLQRGDACRVVYHLVSNA